MADDFGFQPMPQQGAAQQAPAQQPDDFGFQPLPKAPDTSGVQQMAKDNLAANDNKELGGAPKPPQTPTQRYDTGLGMPVNALLNPDDNTPFPVAARKNLTKAYANGEATNAGDFWQTALRALTPDEENGFLANIGKSVTGFVKDTLNPEGAPTGMNAGQYQEWYSKQPKQGYLAQLGAATSLISGAATAPFIPLLSIGGATAQEIYKQSLEPEEREAMPQEEFEKGMNVAGAVGQAITGLGMALEPLAHPPEPLIEAAAKRLDKTPAEVTQTDIDQTIAQGTNHKAPSAADFKAVETVTNGTLNEKTLHIVFNETGIKPDQVFADAQRDPQVATDVAAGKVPEQYEHLVEEKPVLPPKQAEKLTVTKDDATRSFTVVDKEGDHVSGGFDSHEEAQHFIEDEKFKTEERAALVEEGKEKPVYERPADLEKTSTSEQAVIPGAEKVTDATMAQRGTEAPLKGGNSPLEGGLFDVAGRGQKDLLDLANEKVPVPVRTSGEVGGVLGGNEVHPAENVPSGAANQGRGATSGEPQLPKKTIPPSESGKPTSLYTFLRNNGGLKDEGGNLAAMGEKSLIRKNGMAWDDATELAQQHGYFTEHPSIPELQDKLLDTNGGRDHYRVQDVERGLKAKENATARRESDPAYIEDYADKLGLDTTRKAEETERQYTNRLKDAIKEFYKNTEGSGNTLRKIIGDTIVAAEKFVGKLTGGFFEKLANGYMRTFQPELMGDKALRADAYLAKFKAAGQEAENAFYRQSAVSKAAFDKLTTDERMQWLYDHETGRWDAEIDPDHARFQAIYDVMHEAEQKAIGTETAYKENYLPHQWENPEAVEAHFRSEAMIRKYGADWFKKASEFKLIQEGVRAGFKLKTDNPESMLVARQLASSSMIRTMDLLKDMESSGIAKKATTFGIDKKIAKTQEAITELQEKYKKEFEKKNNPKQPELIEGLPPAESKVMKVVEKRMDDLKERLDNFTKEKADNKLTPAQMAELKTGFRVIGPDSKAWNIHQQAAPLWKNAMEMKGLYENQGLTGDAYRAFSQIKNIWTDLKLSLSLFHPFHEVGINLASAIVAPIDHLIQGGKFSELALRDVTSVIPTGSGRGIDAYNTAPEARTPEQHADVQRMLEGGFVPTMSARDMVHFKDNWDKAINGVGLNNLRLIGTALQLPGKIFEPLFSKWIPRLRSEMYFSLTDKALARDPTLAQDAGRRGEVYREISKNIDRTFGQLNQDTLFWNKNVRDAFNASYISGGWKLAQIYNARGLLEPLNIAYKFAKTGEFSKADITYNMLHAYAYTAVTLTMGAAINKMLGNPIGKTLDEAKSIKDYVWSIVEDCLFPKTGDKNPDGTPIRLNQPAFTKEYFMAARDINENGLIGGAGKFLYQGTIIPGIVNTLTNRDFIGHEQISNPTDLHQWTNAGWDAINPITLLTYERAEQKGSTVGKYAGLAGFPIAGAYINQTPFEQKVIAKYDEQNPPKGDAYQAKLKAEMKGAIANKDTEDEAKIEKQMKAEGMNSEQIAHSKTAFKTPFADFAWTKLSAEDQKRLIESASDEEKKKFKVKSE